MLQWLRHHHLANTLQTQAAEASSFGQHPSDSSGWGIIIWPTLLQTQVAEASSFGQHSFRLKWLRHHHLANTPSDSSGWGIIIWPTLLQTEAILSKWWCLSRCNTAPFCIHTSVNCIWQKEKENLSLSRICSSYCKFYHPVISTHQYVAAKFVLTAHI